MSVRIKANSIIDEMISLSQEYEDCRKRHKIKYPNGVYIFETTPIGEIRDCIQQEKVEKAMDTIAYIFRDVDIYSVVRVARKWCERTNWQFCLSEETAEKLIEFYTKEESWLKL